MWRRPWPRALAAIACLAIAFVVVACDDDEHSEPPTLGAVVAGEVETGTEVTVEGEPVRILESEDALIIGDEGGRVLVVNVPDSAYPAIEEGSPVVVTGEVRPLTADELRDAAGGQLPSVEGVADSFIVAELVRRRLAARAGP